MKNFLLMILLFVSFLSCGQAKPTLTLLKGMKKVYVTEMTGEVPGQDAIHMTLEQQYEVVDETPDGYVLDIQVNSLKKDDKNPPGMSFSTAMNIMEGKHCQYEMDKEGKVLRSLSIDEVKEQYRENYLSFHEFSPHETDTIATKMVEEMKEQDLESLKNAISPLALNGKDITDGKEEEFCDANGFKMKRKFRIKTNGSIQSKSTINMKAEDIKELYLQMFKKLGLGVTDDARKNIDEMLKNFNMDYSEEATYTFLPDGWVKTIDCVITKKDTQSAPVTLTYKVHIK